MCQENSAPFVVCVTGQIASGKSTVCSYLGDKGASYISADAISHKLLSSGSSSSHELKMRLVRAFGRDVLKGEEIDRALLASRAFSDKASEELLEEIELPYIETQIRRDLSDAQKIPTPCIVVEIPLLEKVYDLLDSFDEILCVVAPVSCARTRARTRNQTAFDHDISSIHPEGEEQRIADFQYMPEVFTRMSLSSTIIYNAGTHAMLTRHLDTWWNAHILHKTYRV